MGARFGIGLLTLAMLVAIVAMACGASSAVVDIAAAEQPSNPGPAQVTLGDGPAGIAGSRFTDPDVEINLTADVVQGEVLDGEIAEVWGYNGQYPGPEIRVKEGDKVRINLTNNLPEATTIHWHGMEVPNDQDGVPGITQPDIEPGASWTYEGRLSLPSLWVSWIRVEPSQLTMNRSELVRSLPVSVERSV